MKDQITISAKTAQAIEEKLNGLEKDYTAMKQAETKKDQALEKAHAKIASLEAKVANKQKVAAADAFATLGEAIADSYIDRGLLEPSKKAAFAADIASNPADQILALMAEDRHASRSATEVGAPETSKVAEVTETKMDPIAAWALSPA